MTLKMSPPEHAGKTSGIPCANAFITTSTASSAVQSVNVGAGGTACITQPGRRLDAKRTEVPALAGVSGVVSALKTSAPIPIVQPIGMLIGPSVAGCEPAKSMTTSSSVTVDRHLDLDQRVRSMPSSSAKSTAVHVPFGRLARPARA